MHPFAITPFAVTIGPNDGMVEISVWQVNEINLKQSGRSYFCEEKNNPFIC